MKKQKIHHHNNLHRPVLLDDTIRLLAPKAGDSYLDLTAGYGGHAQAVLDRTKRPEAMVLNDRDEEAVAALAEFKRLGAEIIHGDFLSTAAALKDQNRQFDMILGDLGVSSPHFDKAERGFSFRHTGPLDMRMDRGQELTAETIINDWPLARLTEVLAAYGEQPGAVRIAEAIIQSRPLKTTTELAEAVERVSPRKGKTHPATRVFQALRIAVNDELNQLSRTLPLLVDLLADGGRLAVISFHSLEDRIVKRFFKERSVDAGYEASLELLTRRAVHGVFDAHNPRARSARLRAVCKLKTKKEGSS